MTWLNNPPGGDDTEDESVHPTNPTDSSSKQLSLHALRALGIFFIRGAVASLVGFGVAGVGFVIFWVGAGGHDGGAVVLGAIVMGIGAVVGFIWQIVVLIAASDELRKAGV